jgi:hypothetical protein
MRRRPSEVEILSSHRFLRPGIRLWLPMVMLTSLLACGWLITPRIGPFELVALALSIYVTISAVVSVAEISVTREGLIVNPLLMRKRFLPWNAIDRVIVYAHAPKGATDHIEVASIGVVRGLSILNRLPGLVYGQGFHQTVIVTPDAIEDYDTLLTALEGHTHVFWA